MEYQATVRKIGFVKPTSQAKEFYGSSFPLGRRIQRFELQARLIRLGSAFSAAASRILDLAASFAVADRSAYPSSRRRADDTLAPTNQMPCPSPRETRMTPR